MKYINLPTSPSYAFDYLSILEIKSSKNPENKKIIEDIIKVTAALNNQLGSILFAKIYESIEYDSLKLANSLVFDAVDKAKDNSISAREVDDLNYHRYLCKKGLQEKFFNNDEPETKIGY